MIEGEVEVLVEIGAVPQQRGDRFAAHRLRPRYAGHAVPLARLSSAPQPDVVTRAEARDNPTFCPAGPDRASDATAKADPAPQMETG